MLRSFLTVSTLAVVGLATAVPAAAEPPPAPSPIPNVFSYMPVNPAEYTVNGGKWLGFAGPPGVVCIMDILKGEYGCSGPLAGAPDGANVVSAGLAGAPVFTTADGLKYAAAGAVRPLPPNTRLTFRTTACGVDADGVVACLNSREQVGFVVGPTATYIGSNLPPAPPPPVSPAPVTPAPVAPAPSPPPAG